MAKSETFLKGWIPACAGMTKLCIAAGLLAITTSSNARELGRLFFSAEQRAQLEYNRQQPDPAPDNARSLTVNGIVQKHGGERTIWINGVPQPAGNSDERAPESVPVAIPGRSQPVKVGQRVIIGPAATGK
ncbi:MAG: hypothetical protein Q8O58_05115 [Gallionella sp.]|nr:hypothetical protein [Gallionella sp.]